MKISFKSLSGIAGVAVLLIGNTVLAQNLIQNPGFETGDLTGWTPLNVGATATISVLTPGNPGSYAWLDNTTLAYNLGLSQTTPNGSVGGGVTINYSFDLLGGNQNAGGVDFIHIFEQNSGGGVIGQGPGLLGPYFPSASGWTTYTGSFTTMAGTDHLTIEFDATTGAATGSTDQMGIDNVSLTPVPEPTTLALAGLGGMALLSMIRRRK
jgi:hypothetical protein